MPNNLSEPELAVWSSFPRGAWVDLRVGDVSLDNVCDGGAWRADRIVRAEVMRALLLGACPAEPGYTAALRLRGARITGYLDLQGGTSNYALVCEECVFDYPVCLAEATVRTVRLKGTHLPRFDGMRASVAGMLSLQNAVVPDGVRLDYATISGGVRLRGATVGSARDGLAVSAEGVRVDGGLECDEEFSVTGEVLLRNAHIGGSVKMATARISHPGNAALDADMLTVVGELDCTRITIEGESRIRNANIGGPLLLSAACLRNPEGSALRAIRMNIDGGMWCSDPNPRIAW